MVMTADPRGVEPFGLVPNGNAPRGADPCAVDANGAALSVPDAHGASGALLRPLALGQADGSLGDGVVAHVRGLLEDVARQLVEALAGAAHAGGTCMEGGAQAAFVALLASNGTFLGGLHALALEWRLTARLEERQGIDSVLTPLLLAALAVEAEGSEDDTPLALARGLAGAQFRFCLDSRRMRLPLGELPPDLFRIALAALHLHASGLPAADRDDAHSRAIIAERSLRLRFDAERGRLALLRRFAGEGAGAASKPGSTRSDTGRGRPVPDRAGPDDRPRARAGPLAARASPDRRTGAGAAGRRASGGAGGGCVQALHPDALVPGALLAITPQDAAQMLGQQAAHVAGEQA
jgi:hypothetical protein